VDAGNAGYDGRVVVAAAVGKSGTATVGYTNTSGEPESGVVLRLTSPAGLRVTPTSSTEFASVGAGQKVQATFS